jgi:hypothetical protein
MRSGHSHMYPKGSLLSTTPSSDHATVVAAVDEHFPAVVHRAGAEQHVVGAFLDPDLRVAHMTATPLRIVRVAQQGALGAHRHVVLAFHEDLVRTAPLVDEVVLAGLLDVAGVVQAQQVAAVRGGPGHHHGSARVGAVCVVGAVLGDRHAVVLPVDEVAAGVVPPPAGAWGSGQVGLH